MNNSQDKEDSKDQEEFYLYDEFEKEEPTISMTIILHAASNILLLFILRGGNFEASSAKNE